MQGKKILITGPTGQVAKPIATALAEHNEVTGIARFSDDRARSELESKDITCIAVDLADPDFSTVPSEFDYVCNFAVMKSGKWPVDLAGNGECVGDLMSHVRGSGAFLHCSSTAVYAPNGGAPMSEAHGHADHHGDMMPTYSISKIAGEVVARFAAREFNLPTVISRLNVPYGNGGGWPGFHLMMIENDIPIEVHPDGSTYNPIHDDDLLRQLPGMLAQAAVPAPVVNWAGNDIVSVSDWATYLGSLIGKEPTIVESDTALPSAAIDTTLQQSLLGPCEVSWRDGFERMAESLRSGRS